jgi:endonuclease/exonuclease/phosphatase family metal-dependent hydrolase
MQIRVLTYNIHRAIGLDRRFRPERIVQVLEHHQADLVLLQEVDEGAPRSRELDLARELAEAAGYPHRAMGHNVTLRKGRYGNATLSRFPILRERNIDLTIEGKKRRGCQHTTVEVGDGGGSGRRLEIFNLHLGLAAREREQQVGRLVHSNEFTELTWGDLCVVGGDFNDWRSRLRIAFCEVLGFVCVTDREAGGSVRSLNTYPSPSPQGALDKIFVRGPWTADGVQICRLGVSRVASDHLPVIADLTMS